jgi:molybdopterin adenylyltransferase
MQITVGIITISDRSSGEYVDLGGKQERICSKDWLASPGRDDYSGQCEADPKRSAFSQQGCALILTTGDRSRPARRHAKLSGVMRVEIPGFGETMRGESMKITPNAILSRSLAAIVDLSLVIALPGKPSGAVECTGFVVGASTNSVAVAQRVPNSC